MAFICTFLIGIVLFFAGLLKSLYIQPFIGHVTSLKLFPQKSNVLIALLFVEIECGLGMSLILHVYPQELIPFTIFLILVLSVLNYWAVRSGRAEDCGCYGGLITFTPRQSLALNLFYLAILWIGYISQIDGYATGMWKVWIVVITILIGGYLAKQSAKSPLIDLSRLRKGSSWQDSWLNSDIFKAGSFFITFLNRNCADCTKWIDELKNLKTIGNSPTIVCLLPDDSASVNYADTEIKPHFTYFLVDRRLFRRLVFQTPTAVLVSESKVVEKWVADFPDVFQFIG